MFNLNIEMRTILRLQELQCFWNSQQLGVQCFWKSRMTRAIVTLGQAGSTVILAAQLSFVNFVLREEFAFFVSDLFQK